MSLPSPSVCTRLPPAPSRSQLSGLRYALARVRMGVAAWLAALVLVAPAQAQSEGGANGEYQQKARLICNFLRNCKWPARRFQQADSAFVIGIFGSDQISEYLREDIQDRRIQGRPVQIRRISQREELTACHVVFVSRSERDRLRMIIGETRRENILTVGESDNFLASGGVIQFTTVVDQVRYRVSLDAARRERIEPNGFVLRMAMPQSDAGKLNERRIAEGTKP